MIFSTAAKKICMESLGLRLGRVHIRHGMEWSVPQNGLLTSEGVLESLGLDSLLGDVTVLLNGEEEWVLGRCEGVVFDHSDDIHELDFGGEGVAVVDDWLTVWAIPAVHCVCVRERERERVVIDGYMQLYKVIDCYRWLYAIIEGNMWLYRVACGYSV